MEPSASLVASASLSVAIAGFAGVVASFRGESVHEWTAVEKFWLRLLLFNSILALAFSLFGVFVLTVATVSPTAWRWCSGVAALLLSPYAAMIVKNLIGFGSSGLKAAGGNVIASYSLLGVLIAVSILQLFNAISIAAFWPFYGAILALILGAVYQFIRLVLRPQQDEVET